MNDRRPAAPARAPVAATQPSATRGDPGFGCPPHGWRRRLHIVIFESDTPAGRAFDLALIGFILASITVVALDSVADYSARWGGWFDVLEWCFTVAFTAEYLLRLICVQRPLRYGRSVLGVIDLLAALPSYLALFFPSAHALMAVRVLRLLRIFRILKLGAYLREFALLGEALYASRRKILVFLCFVMTVVVVLGSLMYVVEGPANGYTSIPASIYWAIVTMTTVGFGDITPKTDLGRFIASLMMLLGWGTLAVPTGIVSAELTVQRVRGAAGEGAGDAAGEGAGDQWADAARVQDGGAAVRLEPRDGARPAPAGATPHTAAGPRACAACGSTGHEATARFCRDCGTALPPPTHPLRPQP